MKLLERVLFLSVRASAILLPLIVLTGIFTGGYAAYSGVAVVFGYYFGVELLLAITGLGVNFSIADEFALVHPERPGLMERFGIEVYSVLHLVAIPLGIWRLSTEALNAFEWVGGILSLGIMAGSVGGLAGHEFIHRRAKWEKWLGLAVYGSVSYAHFAISHLYGHHRNVGQSQDWSTSRKNETSFHFLGRAFFVGYLAAWKIESKRLQKIGVSGLRFLSAHFMVRLSALMLAFYVFIFVTLGMNGLITYAAVSVLAFTLMEMVNYLSHYGLARKQLKNGTFESVQNKHSWESNNKVTNWFIFNAGKHCHHHRDPFATHEQLLLAHEKDYIPFGLPLMTLIAFVPPLYFWLMNPLVEALDQESKVVAIRAANGLRRGRAVKRAEGFFA